MARWNAEETSRETAKVRAARTNSDVDSDKWVGHQLTHFFILYILNFRLLCILAILSEIPM